MKAKPNNRRVVFRSLPEKLKPADARPCRVCGRQPYIDGGRRKSVGCYNENCPKQPSATPSATIAAAIDNWNQL